MHKIFSLAVLGILALALVSHSAAQTKGAKKPPAPKEKEKASSANFIPAKIKDVYTFPNGANVVMLQEFEGERMVPIWIGDVEALSIYFRLKRQKPPRPLTLDLLEEVMKTLGGKIEKLEIDDLSQNTFFARLYVKQGDKTIVFDARPSDSIGLCLGANAPIFVSKSVIEKSGITEKEFLDKLTPGAPDEEKPPPQAEAL